MILKDFSTFSVTMTRKCVYLLALSLFFLVELPAFLTSEGIEKNCCYVPWTSVLSRGTVCSLMTHHRSKVYVRISKSKDFFCDLPLQISSDKRELGLKCQSFALLFNHQKCLCQICIFQGQKQLLLLSTWLPQFSEIH